MLLLEKTYNWTSLNFGIRISTGIERIWLLYSSSGTGAWSSTLTASAPHPSPDKTWDRFRPTINPLPPPKKTRYRYFVSYCFILKLIDGTLFIRCGRKCQNIEVGGNNTHGGESGGDCLQNHQRGPQKCAKLCWAQGLTTDLTSFTFFKIVFCVTFFPHCEFWWGSESWV